MTETAVDITVDEPEKVDYTKLVRMDRSIADTMSLQGLLEEIEDALAHDPQEASNLLANAQEISYELSEKIENLSGRLDDALHREQQGIAPGENVNPMDYQLVTASDAAGLATVVNKQNSEGWNVSGGVVIGPDGYFYQPMVKSNMNIW